MSEDRVDEIKAEEEKTEAPAEEEAKASNKKGERLFTKAEAEAMVKERLARQAESEQRKRTAAEQQAKIDALKEQEDYKELASTQATELETLRSRVQELEGTQESLQTYEELVNNSVSTRIENLNLPKGIMSLLEDKSPADKQRWLDENEGEFVAGPTATVDAGEDGDEPGPSQEEEEEAKQASSVAFIGGF